MHWTEAEYHTYLSRQQRPHSQAASDLPEAELLAQVRALAKRSGYLVYHTRDSRGSEEGFPDLCLTNGTRVIFAELKSRTGKLTERQALWLELLRHAGAEAYCWRPADWPQIVACLTAAGAAQ